MENFNSLSAQGKEIKWAQLDGRLIYASTPELFTKVKTDEAAVLSAGSNLSSAQYTAPNGQVYQYQQWSTFVENQFTGAGAGNIRPFAVAPHLMVTASHYGDTIKYGSLDIGGKTVNRIGDVNLKDWALSSGKWPAEYINNLNIGDITMVLCDKEDEAIPLSCIPYFITPMQFKGLFQKDEIDGLPGWTSPQIAFNGKKMAAPVIFLTKVKSMIAYNQLEWTTPNNASAYVDPTLSAEYASCGKTYLAYSGDSGRPVYFTVETSEGKLPVVISHYQTVAIGLATTAPGFGRGPDYIQAFDVIREFVKEYEGYDALQQLPATVLSGDYS